MAGVDNLKKELLLTQWRSALQTTRWRRRDAVDFECRRCGWCWTSLEPIIGEVLVDERGAIVLCVCTTCRPHLTIVPERREWSGN